MDKDLEIWAANRSTPNLNTSTSLECMFYLMNVKQLIVFPVTILCFRIAGNESRVAAFDLLVVLAENCPENLKQIGTQLVKMHHQPDPATAREWEVRMCRMKYSS